MPRIYVNYIVIAKSITNWVIKRETQKQKNQQRQKRTRGNKSYIERVRAKWFCWAFKLGFCQLICKASFIFKSNLELALSIISKQKELYKSKHVAVECSLIFLNIYKWKLSIYPSQIKERGEGGFGTIVYRLALFFWSSWSRSIEILLMKYMILYTK